jgi:hypothetical protein
MWARRCRADSTRIDVEGAADLALAEATRNHQPGRSSFGTRLSNLCRGRVLDAVRAEARWRPGRPAHGREIPEAEPLKYVAAAASTECGRAADRVERLYRCGLSPTERQLLDALRAAGGSPDEAARLAGKDKTWASKYLRSIRAKARACGV